MRSTSWVMETTKEKGGRVSREKNKTDKATCMLLSTHPHPTLRTQNHSTHHSRKYHVLSNIRALTQEFDSTFSDLTTSQAELVSFSLLHSQSIQDISVLQHPSYRLDMNKSGQQQGNVVPSHFHLSREQSRTLNTNTQHTVNNSIQSFNSTRLCTSAEDYTQRMFEERRKK